MTVYEVCILGEGRRTLAIVKTAHVNDFAAVRSARTLAGGHCVEVWRDLECIYRDTMHGLERRRHAT